MPSVIRAKILGFCFGARSAVEMALAERLKDPEKTIVTYGPLIHNPKAVERLMQAHIEVLDSPEKNGTNTTVIIRAHGIPPSTRKEIEQAGYTILDATCSRIKASQIKAEKAYRQGCRVILAGDRNHGEIIGIAGFAPDAIIVENREDARRLADSSALLKNADVKTVLIGQTTIGSNEYRGIADVLRSAIPALLVYDTICPATLERQQALTELCRHVDGVLVIGGKNSANTRQLLTIAQGQCPIAALVEDAAEIPVTFFSLSRVGLTAGASTPDDLIDAVESCLQS